MIIKLGLIFRKRYAEFRRGKSKKQAKSSASTSKETSQETINSREITSVNSKLKMILVFLLVFAISFIYFFHYTYPIQYIFMRKLSSYNKFQGLSHEKLSSLSDEDSNEGNYSSTMHSRVQSNDSSRRRNQTVRSIDSSKHENMQGNASSRSEKSSKQGRNRTVRSARIIKGKKKSSSSVDTSKNGKRTVRSAGNVKKKKKSSPSVEDHSVKQVNLTVDDHQSAGIMEKNKSSSSVDSSSSRHGNRTVRSTGAVKGKISSSNSLKKINHQSVQSAGNNRKRNNTSNYSLSPGHSTKLILKPPHDPSLDSKSERVNQSVRTSSSHESSRRSSASVAREGRSKYRKEPKLKRLLEHVAMADKTVILTTLNAAWSAAPNSMFDLFLEGFRIGNQTKHLLKHVIVIALDRTAYKRCRALHPYCYALTTKGADFSGEAVYMTQIYLKMMWRRIDFLRIVLEMGYNFVFTDVDIMWFRNPFPHFYQDADIQVACDYYRFHDPSDLNNELNGGFSFVKSNQHTIQFYKLFYASRDRFPDKHDQDVLNIIKFDPIIQTIGVKIMFLDTAYFGGFCEHSKNLDQVITMHANCCIGLDCKVHDIRMLLDDWKRYMAMTSKARRSNPMTWTTPRICGPRPVR